MKSISIAQVVNYVNTHKDYFGIKQPKATFSDCTGLFRMSKLSTKEMQLFRYCACDYTAEAFLPKVIAKADLKTALNKTKNAKFTDFFDNTEDWTFMRVTPNRMLVFDQIMQNTMPKEEPKPNTEVEELRAKVKQLEGELAQYKKAEPRVLTSYMTLDDNHVVHIDTTNPIGKLIFHYKLTTGKFYDLDEAIKHCETVAVGLNVLCAEFKRAKANGATHLTF